MKLDRIDPRMLAALGLVVACGPKADSDGDSAAGDDGDTVDVTSSACLSAPADDDGATGPAATTGTESVGPCLGQEPPSTTSSDTGTSTTFGPCLDVPPATTSGTDDGTGGSDSGTSTGAGALAPQEPDEVMVERVLEHLPADVASRLRGRR